MKKFSFLAFLMAASVFLLSHTMPVKSNGISGRTTGASCASCHGGGAGGSVALTSNIPANGFVPGATYTMTLTVAEPLQPLFGMDLAAVGGGTLSAGASTQLLNGEIVHARGGSGSGTFTFSWTAPASGTVTFNYAGLACNGDGSEDPGDHTYTGFTTVSPQIVAAGISATASATNVTCFGGNNGTATVTPSGGTAYTYAWPNGQTNQTATGLSAGSYIVTVTSGSQTATATATITQPALLVGSVNTPTVITCAAPSSTISANASGGTAPYTYNWSTTANTSSITVTSAGNYSVSITDSKGCTATKAVAVTGSCVTVPCTTLPTTAPSNVTIVNSTCSANCTASGGSITAPVGACPAGYTLQYSVNGGAWYSAIPTYEQMGTGQSIRTQCSCDSDPTMISPVSVAVATVPGICVNATSAPTLTITNNVLPSLVGTITASGCGAGTVVEYATSAVGPYSTTAPIYTTSPITIFARCRNTTTSCASQPVSGITAPVAAVTTTLILRCPSNINVIATSGTTSAKVNYTVPSATSTCTTGRITTTKTSGLTSGSLFPVGISSICYTATDGCGNTQYCCFNVIVSSFSNGGNDDDHDDDDDDDDDNDDDDDDNDDDDDDNDNDKGKDKGKDKNKGKNHLVSSKQGRVVDKVASPNQSHLITRGDVYTVLNNTKPEQKKLNLYPNPASDIVNLEVSSFSGQAIIIQVVNQFGKIVKTQEIKEANSDLIPISLQNVVNGFYYITVFSKGEKLSQKFIVNKNN